MRHDIDTATLKVVLDGSQTENQLLHVTAGAVFICTGPNQALDACSPTSQGEKLIIPPGLRVAAALNGGPAVIITLPFGA